MEILGLYPVFKKIQSNLKNYEDKINFYLACGYTKKYIKQKAQKSLEFIQYLKIHRQDFYTTKEIKRFNPHIWIKISDRLDLKPGFIAFWRKHLDLNIIKFNNVTRNVPEIPKFLQNTKICIKCKYIKTTFCSFCSNTDLCNVCTDCPHLYDRDIKGYFMLPCKCYFKLRNLKEFDLT